MPPSHPITQTPTPPVYFDYTRAAHTAGLTPQSLRSLVEMFERDYPYDVMLRELHVLRACNAIIRGAVSIDAVFSGRGEQAA